MTETSTSNSSNLDLDQIRQDFPVLNQTIHKDRPLVYFDNGASTQRPTSVIEALRRVYEQSYSNVHRGIHWLSEQSTIQYEESRAKIAEFIDAANDREVIFTSGTTLSTNLVARCLGDSNDPTLRIGEGDEILLTEMEHHSNIIPWQQLAERTGAKVRFVDVNDDGFLDQDSLNECLNPKTRIFAFAAVSNVLGTINPVKQLVQQAQEVGAMTFVDAAQHVPHEPTSVREWGADFMTFSAHKMLGPSGLGILHGRMELLEKMPAFLGGGSMISKVTKEGYVEGLIPARFEAGTPPIAQAISFRAALEYLESVGLNEIKQHEWQLSQLAMEQLLKIDGLRILGPPQGGDHTRAGIVSFVIDGCSPQDISLLVDRQGFAIRAGHHCAMPLHERYGLAASCRASFYLYNTAEEVVAFAEALKKVVDKIR